MQKRSLNQFGCVQPIEVDQKRGETRPPPSYLKAVKSFADQDIYRYSAILGLAFFGIIAG